MSLEEMLLGIKKSFIMFYDESNRDKIEKIFDNLIVIEAVPKEYGLSIEKINCDINKTLYSENDIKELYEDLNSYKDQLSEGFMYPKAPVPTLVVKKKNGIFPVSVIIHEISHLLMVENLADIIGEDGVILDKVRIETMMGTRKYGNYTNEIINEGITKDVLAIFNKLYDSNFKISSGYIQADNILGNPGRKIYELLLPYIKKYMPYNALVITKIMGNSNFKSLSDVLEWQINHILQSGSKKKEEYLEKYSYLIDRKRNESNTIVKSVEENIREYEQYEQSTFEYAERLIADGKARKVK